MFRKIFLGLAALLLLQPLAAQAAALPGRPAPDFSATDITGKPVKLSELRGQYVVLEWTNHLCPFVKKHYGSGNMQALQKKYTAQGVVWLSIISSAPGKEGFVTDDEAVQIAKDRGSMASRIIRDPSGDIGRLYGAKATPHMFIIDKTGTLVYAGAIDSVASTNASDIAGAENYIDRAFNELNAGKPVSTAATHAYGCGVKY